MKNRKKDLAIVCDDLFYNEESDLKGSVGIKNLASTLSLDDKDFEDYIDNL